MFQTCSNSQLLRRVLWINAELTIVSSLKHINTQSTYIFNRENLQESEPQNGPRRGLDFIALRQWALSPLLWYTQFLPGWYGQKSGLWWMLLCPNHQTGFNQFCKTGNRHYIVSFITYFCLLVTLVAWFSFCFFCLALQNVNKGFIIFYYFRNFVAKSYQKPKMG